MLFKRESERNKGIKLLLKILSKIINNPTQTQKYGDLNLQKISQKVSNCQPIIKLLLLSGFEKSQNNKRLTWSNTNNNMIALKHIHTKLSELVTTATKSATLQPNGNNPQSNNLQQTIFDAIMSTPPANIQNTYSASNISAQPKVCYIILNIHYIMT